MHLGKLKKISLREAWKHEAHDFTNWLAQEENLSLLSDEIGIGIELIQTEASVGKFNVDILAQEENTGRKIIIENQLEMTDHGHLGQIITYASGYDAEVVIWIVRGVRDEHKQAIDWLNEHTDEKVNLFIIKMELWQIGDSPFAPKFQIVSKPNDWAKAVKSAHTQVGLSDTKLLQLDFWNGFREYNMEHAGGLSGRSARAQHWYNISIGSTEVGISLTINSREDMIACELYISNNKDLYFFLEGFRDVIEAELGMELEWMPLEDRKASRVKVVRDADVSNQAVWKEYFKWLETSSFAFQKVFGKYLKKYKKTN